MLKHLKWAWALTAITLIAGIATYFQVSPDAELPIHWNIEGEVNGTAQPHIALFMIPGIQFLILALFSALKFLEPRQQNFANSLPAIAAILTGTTILMVFLQTMLIDEALGINIIELEVVFSGMGLLLMILGNYMTKLRSGFFVGIRTPWTLSSDLNWKKTHRIGGRLLIIAGLVIFITSLLYSQKIMIYIIIATVIPAALIPLIYSWTLWRNETKENGNDYS